MESKDWKVSRKLRLTTKAHLAGAAGVSLKTVVHLEADHRVSFESLRSIRAAIGMVDIEAPPAVYVEALPAVSVKATPYKGLLGGLKLVGAIVTSIYLAYVVHPGLSRDAMRNHADHLANYPKLLREAMRITSTQLALTRWRTAILSADMLVANNATPDLSTYKFLSTYGLWNQTTKLNSTVEELNSKNVNYSKHNLMISGEGLTLSADENTSKFYNIDNNYITSAKNSLSITSVEFQELIRKSSSATSGVIKEYYGVNYIKRVWSGGGISKPAWVRVVFSPIPSDVCQRMLSEMSVALPGRLQLFASSVLLSTKADDIVPPQQGWPTQGQASCAPGWNAVQALVTAPSAQPTHSHEGMAP